MKLISNSSDNLFLQIYPDGAIDKENCIGSNKRYENLIETKSK